MFIGIYWMFFATIPAISGVITSGTIWGSEDDLLSQPLLYASTAGAIMLTMLFAGGDSFLFLP